MSRLKLLLPPARCQRCIDRDPCADCREAPDHVRNHEARRARLERLWRYYTSGEVLRDWNRKRRELGLGPIGGREGGGR